MENIIYEMKKQLVLEQVERIKELEEINTILKKSIEIVPNVRGLKPIEPNSQINLKAIENIRENILAINEILKLLINS